MSTPPATGDASATVWDASSKGGLGFGLLPGSFGPKCPRGCLGGEGASPEVKLPEGGWKSGDVAVGDGGRGVGEVVPAGSPAIVLVRRRSDNDDFRE